MSRAFTRTWPIWLGVLGIVLLGYGTWKLATNPPALDEDGDPYDEWVAPADPSPDEHWEQIESFEVDEFQEFPGVVKAKGTVPVRAPWGMRVPVVRVHHESGEFVKKGDALFTLQKDRVERAIEKAEEDGDEEKVRRFREYLKHVVIRAESDGQIVEIFASVGDVPLDETLPLATMTAGTGWFFEASVPQEISVNYALGDEVTVRVEDVGDVEGTLNSRDLPSGVDGTAAMADGSDRLVIGLFPTEGLEPRMRGVLLLPTGKTEMLLVPKKAVEKRGTVNVVRVYDDGEILEQTLAPIEGERGDHYIVKYGVHPGQPVIVPD